jgi:hypothetical protein
MAARTNLTVSHRIAIAGLGAGGLGVALAAAPRRRRSGIPRHSRGNPGSVTS